jgi:hypothetical protein
MSLYNLIARQKSLNLFLMLSVLLITANFLTQKYVLTHQIYYDNFSEQLSISQIDGMINNQQRALYIVYPLEVVFLLFKCLIIAMIIQTGLFVQNLKVNFPDIFKVAVISEFTLLFPLIIKFVWFYFFKQEYTFEEIKLYYPLSILNLLDIENLSLIWFYPLKLMNVFELLYWFVLAYGLSRVIQKDFDRSLFIILTTYLPALVIWVVFIMFLIVTLNPS